jgi:hypothetical protein
VVYVADGEGTARINFEAHVGAGSLHDRFLSGSVR